MRRDRGRSYDRYVTGPTVEGSVFYVAQGLVLRVLCWGLSLGLLMYAAKQLLCWPVQL